MTYLLALDQGTSSSRAIVFDQQGQIISSAQQEFPQIYPQSGWVEHDPLAIWSSQLSTAQLALKQHQIPAHQIKAIGITNQRETTLLWDKRNGKPIHNAIVWQDRRSESLCQRLRSAGHEKSVLEKTGLRIDAYFSATKIAWLFEQKPELYDLADQGHLAFGTVDSWLIWQLSKGNSHCTDVSNASRTLLFNIHTQQWDSDLLRLFNIPASILPTVQSSSSHFGMCDADFLGHRIPITGVAGDQQSALFGQACFEPGMAKNTYGTGCFMLMHTGSIIQQSSNGLISTCAAQPNGTPAYALEGSVFVAGAVVQWLRDGLGAFTHSHEIERLALSVPDSGGVTFVPAFTGLGAPYWDANARGTITGLSRGSTMAHIARAALESIAYQSTALLEAMSLDALQSGAPPLNELRVDGGASQNNLLMQFQADLLGIPVVRPTLIETTALGAAYLAGLGAGVYQNTDELQQLWQIDRVFEPQIDRQEAQQHMQRWHQAITQTCA